MLSPTFRTMLEQLFAASAPGRRPIRKGKRGFRPALELLENRLVPSTDVWTGADAAAHNNFNWTDGNNWSLGRAPGSGDTAVFNNSAQSGNSIVNGNFTVNGLTIEGNWGGTITVNDNSTLTLTGSNLWQSGIIITGDIGSKVVNSGTLTLSSQGGVSFRGGGLLQNNGTIDQTGSGDLSLVGDNNGVTLNNAAGAVYNIQADSGVDNANTSGQIVNAGTIEKTAGQGTSEISANLTNTGGTLFSDSSGGILDVEQGSATNGTFEAATGATLQFNGDETPPSNFTASGTFTCSGSGAIELDNGLLIGKGGATFNVPTTLTVNWAGGPLNVPSGTTLTYNGALNVTSSVGGTVLGGGGTFVNNGTITQSGSGSLAMTGTTTLDNPAQGIINMENDNGISTASNPVIDNAGLIEKTGGTNTSTIQALLANKGGTLKVQSGTLQLAGNGGLSTGGVFNVSTGAALDLTGGNLVEYSGTYTGSGGGQVKVGTGTLQVFGTSGATFNLPSNMFVWSGAGTIDTNGSTLSLIGSLTITGTGSSATEILTDSGNGAGQMTVTGRITDTGVGNSLNIGNNTTLAVGSKGVFNLAQDATVTGNGTLQVLSGGLLEKTGGTSAANISTALLDNEGEVEVTLGILQVSSTTVDQISGGVLTGGKWVVAGGANTAKLSISSASFSTIGKAATVQLNGASSSFLNLPRVTDNQGSLSLLGGASLTTASNFTDDGTLVLGAGSTLAVNGTFTENADGTMTEEVGGTTSSPTFGGISATKGVTLAGGLKVTSTVVPAVNSTFEIINNSATSAVSGAFVGLPEGSTFAVKVGTTTMTFKITYKGGTGNDVVLTRLS